ncbi:MAG: hypothetical protein CMP47_00455 [Rickettsiales bacterium]|nr:hypothetical protein [Rickettsiales bacterium]
MVVGWSGIYDETDSLQRAVANEMKWWTAMEHIDHVRSFDSDGDRFHRCHRGALAAVLTTIAAY